MLNFLSQPYPVNEKTFRQNLITSFFEGLFVAAFLVVLKPFGVASVDVVANKDLILASYGLITTLASFLFKSLRAKLFSTVLLENQWMVGYEILANLLFLVFLAFCNTFYTKILFTAQMGFNDYLNMLLMVVLIGIFPTTFGVLWNYINELKKHNRPFEIKHEEVLVPTNQAKLKIIAENEKDFLEVQQEDLLFLESSDNYTTVFYAQNNQLQKLLFRSSLSRLETQLNLDVFKRCHRSFVVNINAVARVSGNAQGYKFHLQQFELIVPVARKHVDLVERLR